RLSPRLSLIVKSIDVDDGCGTSRTLQQRQNNRHEYAYAKESQEADEDPKHHCGEGEALCPRVVHAVVVLFGVRRVDAFAPCYVAHRVNAVPTCWSHARRARSAGWP